MAMQGFQQVQKQSQNMVLAPQLRQSLKILQVAAMDLRSAIREELESNPTLEELSYGEDSIEAQSEGEGPGNDASEETDASSDPVNEAPSAEETPEAMEGATSNTSDDLDFGDDFSVLQELGEDWNELLHEEAGEIPYSSEAEQRRQHFFDSLTGEESFQENLVAQARSLESDPEILESFEFVLGSMDDSGFIQQSASDIALMASHPLDRIQKAIQLLQSLEPAGLGARNVQDSLVMQLERKGLGSSLAVRIIRKKWDLLIRRRIPEIARSLRTKVPEVERAIAQIALLEPAPAKKLETDASSFIEADVTVQRDEGGEWQIVMNSDYIPRLRINPQYKRLLATGQLRGKDREYLQSQFRNSRFLISAIEQRQMTIERITRELLDLQAEFFEKGRRHLKPLTMAQVADRVGVHETTVSRAVSGKYIRTPFGLFEMKFFFTPGYTGEDGESVSNKSVKDRIAAIIDSELPSKPLSDQKVVEILKKEGISIARRTVAKYREELGILPTNLRRQYG
jgi:RNA polymerase sigma-54 factor